MLILILLFGWPLAGFGQQPGTSAQTASAELSREELLGFADSLEDQTRREQLVKQLRALPAAQEPQAQPEEDVRTATAELLRVISERVSGATRSAAAVAGSVARLPELASELTAGLKEPAVRQRWLTILARLLGVWGAGFLAARLLRWIIRRWRNGMVAAGSHSLTRRLLILCGYLLLDLLPIAAFAAAAYGTLALLDPGAEIRLVALALVNASILSRAILAAASFFLAQESPQLRLWAISDETAHYAHQWIRRIGAISIYGFFGLEAGLLLGLDDDLYQAGLRLLGLAVLVLLLILVAQNRQEVATAIAGDGAAAARESERLRSLRRGLSRVWHLIAGLYLILLYGVWALQIQDGFLFVLRATVLSLLVVATLRLVSRGVDHLVERGVHVSGSLRAAFPELERRLNRYFPLLRRTIQGILTVFTALVVMNLWGLNTLDWMMSGPGGVFIDAALNIVLILAVSVFVWELASGGIERYLSESDADGSTPALSARTRTLLSVSRNALLVMLTVIATLMILSELGVNIAPLLAGAGVVGLAIGFGAQRLVQDVINGVFILFQDLMSVGDVVKLGDTAGVVEALSIRTVRLRDLAGTVHTIPFSAIERVSNLTRDYSYHVFDLGIAYRKDVDEVVDLLMQIGEQLRGDPAVGPLILEPVEVFGLDAFGDSAIMIKGRIKTLPIKQWQVGRAFNRLVKRRFDEAGIEIPFPHRTLYFGQDKAGAAPPAFVQLEEVRPPAQTAAPGGQSSGADARDLP